MPGRTTKPEPEAQDAAMEDAPPSAQPEDAPMDEGEEGQQQEEEEEEEEEPEPQRVRIVSLGKKPPCWEMSGSF
jgi:DNA-directed RNA polymerase I and III subunit RPAC2